MAGRCEEQTCENGGHCSGAQCVCPPGYHGPKCQQGLSTLRVQNALARIYRHHDQKRDHITPVLARVHWLPVTARIQFRIALLTFKTLTAHQPSYIHDLLQSHCSSRQLRSASHNLLKIPRMRTGFAQRSFAYSAPHIWNSLPHVITGNLDVTANTFKKKLKTFYYTNCYP